MHDDEVTSEERERDENKIEITEKKLLASRDFGDFEKCSFNEVESTASSLES